MSKKYIQDRYYIVRDYDLKIMYGPFNNYQFALTTWDTINRQYELMNEKQLIELKQEV